MPAPKNIVPPASFVPRPAATPPPALQNHGGPVLGAVQVVPIYWGSGWSTGVNPQLSTNLDAFFDFILTSSLIDLLAQYSTSTPIKHGSRLPSARVTTDPGTVVGGNRQVSDSQIQQAVQGWINAGTVHAATPNTLYFVFLAPNVQVVDATIGSSCTELCGYHNFFGASIYYAVIPYANCTGCVFPGDFLDTLTVVASHELCEAITDPTLSTWWDPNSGNEIGDICNRQTTRLGKYLVQEEWSNSQSACVIK